MGNVLKLLLAVVLALAAAGLNAVWLTSEKRPPEFVMANADLPAGQTITAEMLGSIPVPGPSTVRYGGNTSCIEVRADGEIIILDAGSGIRELGIALEREFGERRIFQQRCCRQVEKPRGNHATAPPHFCDIGQIQIILVMLGNAKRRCFGVHRVGLLANVRRAQDTKALGIRRN